MFTPTREQVRQFFIDTWRKYRESAPLAGLETTALEVLLAHPEYQPLLEDAERSRDRDYTPEYGETNPFLHLSLHLALAEQLSIDQPQGIRAAVERIVARRGDRHESLHAALECLGETVWKASRENTPPDGEAYLDCLRGLD